MPAVGPTARLWTAGMTIRWPACGVTGSWCADSTLTETFDRRMPDTGLARVPALRRSGWPWPSSSNTAIPGHWPQELCRWRSERPGRPTPSALPERRSRQERLRAVGRTGGPLAAGVILTVAPTTALLSLGGTPGGPDRNDAPIQATTAASSDSRRQRGRRGRGRPRRSLAGGPGRPGAEGWGWRLPRPVRCPSGRVAPQIPARTRRRP